MPQQSRGTGIFKDFPDRTASVVSGYENGTGKRFYLSFIRNSSMCRLWGTYDTKGVYSKWKKKYVYLYVVTRRIKCIQLHRIKRGRL